jgi:hypothetical protein
VRSKGIASILGAILASEQLREHQRTVDIAKIVGLPPPPEPFSYPEVKPRPFFEEQFAEQIAENKKFNERVETRQVRRQREREAAKKSES